MRNVGSLLSRDCRGLTDPRRPANRDGQSVWPALFREVLTEAAAIISGPQAVIGVD